MTRTNSVPVDSRLDPRVPAIGIAAGLAAMSLALPQGVLAQQSSPPEPARTQLVEAYISEDALQVLYGRNLDVGEFGRNDARAGFFINEQRDLIGIADMLFSIGEPQRRPNWSLL